MAYLDLVTDMNKNLTTALDKTPEDTPLSNNLSIASTVCTKVINDPNASAWDMTVALTLGGLVLGQIPSTQPNAV